MKKNAWVITLMVLLAGASLVYAEEMQGDMTDQGMKGGMMEGGKQGMMKTQPMEHMMMKSMMEATVVATSDGGVVVLKGNTLTKYDKKLEVVNEVEVKTDMEKMQKSMHQMMEACPMMQKMMHGGMMGPGMKGNTTDTQGQKTEESEHESHH